MSASNIRGAALVTEPVMDEVTSLSEEAFDLLREKAERLKGKTVSGLWRVGSDSIFLTTGYAGSGPGSAHNRRLRNKTTRIAAFLRNAAISRANPVIDSAKRN
jgi:hypothetical protein